MQIWFWSVSSTYCGLPKSRTLPAFPFIHTFPCLRLQKISVSIKWLFLKKNLNSLILFDKETAVFFCYLSPEYFDLLPYIFRLFCIAMQLFFTVSLTDGMWLFKLYPVYILVHHPLFNFNNLKDCWKWFYFLFVLIAELSNCDGNSWKLSCVLHPDGNVRQRQIKVCPFTPLLLFSFFS